MKVGDRGISKLSFSIFLRGIIAFLPKLIDFSTGKF